jgi:hypothetical protein
LVDGAVIVAVGPLNIVFGDGQMSLVSLIGDHESKTVHQWYLVGWVYRVQMLGFKITIHDQIPGKDPGRGIICVGL